MTDRSLLIVRGGRNEPDPTFSCIAHSTDPGKYVAVEFENGLVTNRTLYRGAERKALERMATNPAYTSVFADTRTDKHLLPFRFPNDALSADLTVFRRAKSDEEISSIQQMAQILDAARRSARDEQHFRGVVDSLDLRHAVMERRGTEFTVNRYGLQDAHGRSVELASVTPHTLDWRARMLRVNDGCRAVETQLKEGVTAVDIDKTFRSHLNPKSDVVYGSVLHHTGYQPWEDDLKVDVLKEFDVLTICPIVGDKRGNTVPYMHSVKAITDHNFRGDGASYETLFCKDVPTFRGFTFRENDKIGIAFQNDIKNIASLLYDRSGPDMNKDDVRDLEELITGFLHMTEYGGLIEPVLIRLYGHNIKTLNSEYDSFAFHNLILRCIQLKDDPKKLEAVKKDKLSSFLLTAAIGYHSYQLIQYNYNKSVKKSTEFVDLLTEHGQVADLSKKRRAPPIPWSPIMNSVLDAFDRVHIYQNRALSQIQLPQRLKAAAATPPPPAAHAADQPADQPAAPPAAHQEKLFDDISFAQVRR